MSFPSCRSLAQTFIDPPLVLCAQRRREEQNQKSSNYCVFMLVGAEGSLQLRSYLQLGRRNSNKRRWDSVPRLREEAVASTHPKAPAASAVIRPTLHHTRPPPSARPPFRLKANWNHSTVNAQDSAAPTSSLQRRSKRLLERKDYHGKGPRVLPWSFPPHRLQLQRTHCELLLGAVTLDWGCQRSQERPEEMVAEDTG